MTEVYSGMSATGMFQGLLTAMIYACAGALFFFHVFNRRMHRMRRGMDKAASLLGLSILTLALPAVLGWVAASMEGFPFLARWAFPALAGLAWLWGEARLAWQKRSMRGAAPVEVSPPIRLGLDFLRHPVTTLDLTLVTYEVPWDGPALTVAQVSDLHLNSNIPLNYFQKAIKWANQTNPDLVFLSGDFVTHSHNISGLTDLLQPLHTTGKVKVEGIPAGKAVFASLGNHDYWAGAQAIRESIQAAGATLLSVRWVEIQVGDRTVRLGGDDSPWGPRIKALTPPLSTAEPSPKGRGEVNLSMVLSHAPDNIYRLVKIPGCAAVFSGHVHGGQMRLPLLGSYSGSTALIVPSAYGRRFDRGHFVFPSPQGQKVHLFVSAGVGAAEPPLRLYCPPEVLVVRFIPK